MLLKELELSALQNVDLQSSEQPVRNNNDFNLPKNQEMSGEHLEGMTISHTKEVHDTTVTPREKAGAGEGGKEQFVGKINFNQSIEQKYPQTQQELKTNKKVNPSPHHLSVLESKLVSHWA